MRARCPQRSGWKSGSLTVARNARVGSTLDADRRPPATAGHHSQRKIAYKWLAVNRPKVQLRLSSELDYVARVKLKREYAHDHTVSTAAQVPARQHAFALVDIPGGAQCAGPAGAAAGPAPDPLARMNESVDALTSKVWPSVVHIMVSSYAARRRSAGQRRRVVDRQQSTGSGFVIDPEGYILTNAHVVNGARRVQIVLPADNADGTLATALSTKTQDHHRADRRHHH